MDLPLFSLLTGTRDNASFVFLQSCFEAEGSAVVASFLADMLKC